MLTCSTRRRHLPALALAAVLLTFPLLTGCSASTRGRFVLPPDSTLEVNKKKVEIDERGEATMKAFGWSGARYRVLRGGEVVSEGVLPTKIRWISVVWPPFGILYVPKGLDQERTYDLSEQTQPKNLVAKDPDEGTP